MAETREQRRERENREWIEAKTPKCCPKCGGTNLAYHLVTWFAHSLDDQDLHNTAELAEHQCHDCAISFWM
jgi:NAD-dependent SIR2 family protein deacetylase